LNHLGWHAKFTSACFIISILECHSNVVETVARSLAALGCRGHWSSREEGSRETAPLERLERDPVAELGWFD
jgi:hypothetical protein